MIKLFCYPAIVIYSMANKKRSCRICLFVDVFHILIRVLVF